MAHRTRTSCAGGEHRRKAPWWVVPADHEKFAPRPQRRRCSLGDDPHRSGNGVETLVRPEESGDDPPATARLGRSGVTSFGVRPAAAGRPDRAARRGDPPRLSSDPEQEEPAGGGRVQPAAAPHLAKVQAAGAAGPFSRRRTRSTDGARAVFPGACGKAGAVGLFSRPKDAFNGGGTR